MAKVIIAKVARENLQEISDYIGRELSNPMASKVIVDGLMKKCYSLNIFPQRQPLLDDKLNKSKGLRMLPYKNYNIFYFYNDDNETVYIIRVLYGKCDWKSMMK